VADQLPNLQRRYQEWAQENANLMGSLLVKIKLDAAGNVAKVENSAARIMDGKFRGAVLEELRQWKFTRGNLGAVDFTLLLLFVPQGMDARHIVRWEKSLAAANAQIKPVPDGAASIARKLLEAGSSMMPLNFVLLILAILLWAMSLFLVAEAAKGLKWVVGERPGAPQPFSGVDMSQLLSCFFVLLWLARQLLLTKPGQNPFSFLSDLLVNPESLTPGILLAVFPPLVVGMMKLITAMGAARRKPKTKSSKGISFGSTWFFSLCMWPWAPRRPWFSCAFLLDRR